MLQHPHPSIVLRTYPAQNIEVTIVVVINASAPERKEDYKYLVNLFKDNPQYVFQGYIQSTSASKIEKFIKKWTKRGINSIFIIGGTGFEPFDNTPEIMEKFNQSYIPAYGQLLTLTSYNKWLDTNKNFAIWFPMGTRAFACKYENTILFSMPGSHDGILLASDIIINSLNRIVYNMFYKQNEKL